MDKGTKTNIKNEKNQLSNGIQNNSSFVKKFMCIYVCMHTKKKDYKDTLPQ